MAVVTNLVSSWRHWYIQDHSTYNFTINMTLVFSASKCLCHCIINTNCDVWSFTLESFLGSVLFFTNQRFKKNECKVCISNAVWKSLALTVLVLDSTLIEAIATRLWFELDVSQFENSSHQLQYWLNLILHEAHNLHGILGKQKRKYI